MRGSPLLRTLLIFGALLLAGLGLFRLTTPTKPTSPSQAVPTQKLPPPPSSATFELILSATAKSVTLDFDGISFTRENTASPLEGRVGIPGDHPLVSLKVIWADTSPGHRFAKLRLDRSGRDSIEHVFSAPGDIDDIWEP
ncbi:MAG: hypothetical protein EAZ84_11355 [Verrucomicrobia bacterium]|nr:MAG: hypothetical protein EAZ84_11355 [Verrucomicrobiota bacterium]TAE85694.1 MAG: hypothetical protein EAZ82_12985 [Verrucomicrobiota bacterium]TAF23088.1 MAG: hypothetical protein EAZ71_13185 [Verrucomicrobiota bacterium]